MSPWIPAVAALSLMLASCTTAPPAPPRLPCKSAIELKDAVRYVVASKDTNLLWQLHYWDGVEPRYERVQKWAALSILGMNDRRDVSITSFGIRPPVPNDNVPVRRRDGTVTKLTLPIEGHITLSGTVQSPLSEGRPTKGRFRNAPLPFGRDTNGNYWLTVMYAVHTNAAVAPPKR